MLAYIGSRLSSPGIVQVYDISEIDSRLYFGREYVDGLDFARHLRSGRATHPTVAAILAKVVRTVQLIHESGIRHGNLALENVLVPNQGDAKLIGFSSARFARPDVHAFDPDIRALGQLLIAAVSQTGQLLPEVMEAITMKCEAAGSDWGYRSASEVADDLDRFLRS